MDSPGSAPVILSRQGRLTPPNSKCVASSPCCWRPRPLPPRQRCKLWRIPECYVCSPDLPPRYSLSFLFAVVCRDSPVCRVEGLNLLQHRGQDAAGVVCCGHKGRFTQAKANGMVRDVLDAQAVASLVGSMGVGHGECDFFFIGWQACDLM